VADKDSSAARPVAASPRVRGVRLRGSILRRAADLASIDGLDQVSIARLAAAMEMSKSGLYAYFTSKQDLQIATIDCAWAVFEEHVLEPSDDLDALLARWVSYYEREVFPGGCLFVTAGVEFANRDGPVHDALRAAIDRQVTALEDGIAGARQSGRLHPDADPRQLGFELHAILAAGNQRFRISQDPIAFVLARTAIARLLQRPD
jgi:AcrR family transcriptional regulator